ncbi:lysyl-tRNA synthetase [Lipomyces oligophaga]|uniref:lysyl-tRNA synthetase n=1 Tax=Lipomyces oligophaga TaxID=45792 RepID=UPI0034CF3E94
MLARRFFQPQPCLLWKSRPCRLARHSGPNSKSSQSEPARPQSTISETNRKDEPLVSDFQSRLDSIIKLGKPLYPIIPSGVCATEIATLKHRYGDKTQQQLSDLVTSGESNPYTIYGRVTSIRTAGRKLVFLDIERNEDKIQGIYRFNSIAGLEVDQFTKFSELLRAGDFISFTGIISRTNAGELSLRSTAEITLLSPCLHPLPEQLSDRSKSHHRTVDFIINPTSRDLIRARSQIISLIRSYFLEHGFLEVQTPILSDVAGGANARPFTTHALLGSGDSSTTSGIPLELRVAPELWLKRLIIGGFDKVFEIGQVFRNEGIDHIHNPEFTTCEFYEAFASLESLISTTEELISTVVQQASAISPIIAQNIRVKNLSIRAPFPRIDFIPALQQALDAEFPGSVLQTHSNFDSEDYHLAIKFLESIFTKHGLPLPSPPTIPRMLDKLADKFLLPVIESFNTPVFLINFPESLSPLSKSTSSGIARRFELYICGTELVNAYEEENSPFSQRKKFSTQQRDRDHFHDLESLVADQSYLTSMEWALPPTGGWGIGIDRLVMLLTGAEKINQILAFGGIKNVVKQE